MDRAWDVVVLGTGSGGKLAAVLLAQQGLRVLAVERGRFGGYCPYVACVPAKSVLASAHAGLGWDEAVRRRDDITHHRDDSAGRRSLEEQGVTCLRGRGRLDGRSGGGHRVRVEGPGGGQEVTAGIVVLATGSTPERPPVDGLDDVPTWTSEEALSADARPDSLLVLGGGPVGCELAQSFGLLGSRVTVVEVSDRLLSSESPWVGETVAEQLALDGVHVVLGATATAARPTAHGLELRLDDGRALAGQRVLLAGGRTPCSGGLGVEEGWLDDQGRVTVDARCHVVDGDGAAVPGLFAVGDLTADSQFTHSANYQARVVADEVAGHGHDAVYDAIPRAVYVSPSVFCVGLTPERATRQGRAVRVARADLADVEKAALSPRQPVPGGVELTLDAGSGVLLGASCVGPEADAWGAELALAVRAGLPRDLLADHVRAFPTWSEVVSLALEDARSGP
jgi:dihydrolipoamide dehydrogenase